MLSNIQNVQLGCVVLFHFCYWGWTWQKW